MEPTELLKAQIRCKQLAELAGELEVAANESVLRAQTLLCEEGHIEAGIEAINATALVQEKQVQVRAGPPQR